MPRLKLEEQAHYPFRATLTVRVTDLNYGNHLSNDALVGLMHEARVQFLASLGCRETDLGDGQTGLIMGDLLVNFRQEGFLFDTLQLDCLIADLTPKSFRVYYRVCKNDAVLALAETGMIAFNYRQRQTTPLPGSFLHALENFQGNN